MHEQPLSVFSDDQNLTYGGYDGPSLGLDSMLNYRSLCWRIYYLDVTSQQRVRRLACRAAVSH